MSTWGAPQSPYERSPKRVRRATEEVWRGIRQRGELPALEAALRLSGSAGACELLGRAVSDRLYREDERDLAVGEILRRVRNAVQFFP